MSQDGAYSGKVLPILREVREMLMPYHGNAGGFRMKDNNDETSPVTGLDLKVEKFLAKRLKEEYPMTGFVGEEFGGDRDQKSFWICDPIDGTGHFVRGLPFCTTMLALIDKGEIVFSAIYHFVTDEMYSAEKGMGAKMNGSSIHVSDRPADQSYICWESRIEKQQNMEVFQKMSKRVLFKAVVAGYEYSMIASGKLDGRVCLDPWGFDYDFIPGAFLVAEAGGVVRNIGKTSYDYRDLDFIAANPVLYRDLTEGPEAVFPLS